MEKRWYQFSIRGILGATFWIAICLGCVELLRWWKAPDQHIELVVAIGAGVYLSPFIAIGTLFGHPLRGLVVGVVLVGGYVLAIAIGIFIGWIPFQG
jgi:hypothetical protein